MEIDLTTPALLFPAISLLLLAFTNRFLALANLIRGLKKQYEIDHDSHLLFQLKNLRQRIVLIRDMQAFGILSLLLCVVCMFAIYMDAQLLGKILFGSSLVLMMVSLLFSIREILISVNALNIELKQIQEEMNT